MIGNLGSLIIFEVNDSKIFTFEKMKKDISAKWAQTDRIGDKPLSEFLAPKLDTLSFTIKLNAFYGVRPRAVLDEIERAVKEGEVFPFILDGKKVGTQWKITKLSETWDTLYNDGKLAAATASLTLEEYV